MPGVIAAPDDAAYLLIDRRGDPLMQAIANPTIRLSHRDSGVVTAVTTDECTHDGREPAHVPDRPRPEEHPSLRQLLRDWWSCPG
jgi:hypothetical protein